MAKAVKTIVLLPEVMDLNAAKPLAEKLLALEGHPLALDASSVRRIGGLCLQVLLAARKSWAAQNVPMEMVRPSPAFAEALTLLGAPFLIA